MKRWELYIELFIELLMTVITMLLIFFLGPKLLAFMWPFVVGGILSAIAYPVCKFLETKFKISKKFGSAFIIVIVILLLALVMYLVLSKLWKEALDFTKGISDYIDIVSATLQSVLDRANGIMERRNIQFFQLPTNARESVQQVTASIYTSLTNAIKDIGTDSVQYAGIVAENVSNGLVGTIIALLSSYFYITEHEFLKNTMKKVIPLEVQKRLFLVKQTMIDAVGGYVIAQIKLMFVMFVILFLGLIVLRAKYSLFLALVICILDILPILGVGTILIPWAVISLLQHNFWFAFGLIIIQIICFVTRQLLQPKIIGDSVGMNPFVTLVLIFVGLRCGGLIGCIVAIICGMIVKNLLKAGMFDSKLNRMKFLYRKIKQIEDRDLHEDVTVWDHEQITTCGTKEDEVHNYKDRGDSEKSGS